MIFFNRYWLALVLFATVIALPVKTMAFTPTVVISEIAWAGSSLSSSDEWIELTNVSTEPTDISGWSLVGAGSGGADIVIPEETTIEPNETYLIANYDQSHENAASATDPEYVTATLSLSNDGFTLYLHDRDGTQIDSAGDGGTPYAGGSGSTQDNPNGLYRTMVRVDVATNGSSPTAWTDATSSIGYKDAVEDLGSPGSLNVTAIQESLTEEVVNDETEEITEPNDESLVEEIVPEEEVDMTVNEEEMEPEINEETEVEVEAEKQTKIEVNEILTEESSEQAPEEIEQETEEETLISYTQGDVMISEFVSDPFKGEAEWIEIQNVSGETIYLTNWTVKDETDRSTTLPDQPLQDGEFHIIVNPAGQLNNDGDSILLFDGYGTLIASVTYGTDAVPAPDEGMSVGWIDGEMMATEVPTPGEENLALIESVEEEIASEDETAEETVLTTIRFDGLYPNTSGSDANEEFITLHNYGNEQIDLEGWIIIDTSGKEFSFEETTIEPQESLTLTRGETAIALNNDGDTLSLMTPNGVLVDLVSYGKASQGAQFVYTAEGWEWKLPEPTTVQSTASVTNSSQKVYGSASVGARTIADALNLVDDVKVTLEGSVTVTTGVFASQFFYIQDETAGIQVYKYDAEFPNLQEGDVVTFTGTLSTSYGERRIKIASGEEVRIVGSAEKNPVVLDLPSISDAHIGSLIQTEGMVQSRTSNKIYLEQNGTELTVYLNTDPPIDAEQFSYGSIVHVTGILTTSNGELRLRPRSQDDISFEEKAIVIAGTTSGKDAFQQTQSQMGYLLVVMTVAAMGLFAIRHFYPRRRRQLAT